MSLNEKRRHLSSSQKAVIALEVERLIGAEERRGRPSKEDITQNFEYLSDDRNERTNTAALLKICAEDTETYEMVRTLIESEATVNSNGTNQYTVGFDISNPTTQGGTGRQYIIARLKRDGQNF